MRSEDYPYRTPDARWEALKAYLIEQINGDEPVHRAFLDAGDMVTAATYGGLLSANRRDKEIVVTHTDECAEQINAYDECLNPDCDCECHPYDQFGYISGESA